MIERVDTVGFGRPASAALAAVIARAQADHPLAPVTVVVPSNLAGLAARRTLAAGLDRPARGLANVSFVTVLRLAQLMAAGVASERQPLTNPVLASAVRRALRDDPRPFGEVADHVATEAAVAATYAELSRLTPEALAALRTAERGTTAASLFQRVKAQLADYDDEDGVVRAVLARRDLAVPAGALGHVVWYLPEHLSPAQTQLMRRLLELAPSSVVAGLTGEAAADDGTRALCRRAGVDLGTLALVEVPVADRIVSVADPDQEAREVVRAVVGLVTHGVALDRIGVFYPVADPYARIIEQHMAAAGLPANGPSADRLSDSVAARTLRAALALRDEGWRRDRVMGLIAAAPVRAADEVVRPTAWERISRQAGVVGGLADWERKLSGFIADADALAADPTSRLQARGQRDGPPARALLAFVQQLGSAVGTVEQARTWAEKAAAAAQLLVSLLGSSNRQQRWPDGERDDLDRVHDALSRLSTLDAIEPHPSTDVFRRALDAELDVSRGRTQPYGTGLVHGPLATAVGQDLDAVFVVGMLEGLCPTGRRDEALLPEAVRLLAAGELVTPDEAIAGQHRALLAALAAAPPGRRTLTLPRGDLRSSRHGLPSRWLLDTASALAGDPVYSTEFADLRAPFLDIVPSFAAALGAAEMAPSLGDRDLAAVAAFTADGGDALAHPAAAGVRRPIAMQRARRSSQFTEFDGNLAGQRIPSPADGVTLLSPTRLEQWAQCGFRYFLQYALGIEVHDDPERIVTTTPLDRGSVMHAVLERFIQEAIEAGPPDPQEPWSVEARERLHAIADDCFAELARKGRSGRPLLWAIDQRALHRALDGFLADDDAVRAATGAVPRYVEFSFGVREQPPAVITLDDGRTLRFRGTADRVDTTRRGHTVIDYKTGRGSKYKHLDDDPVLAGQTLQLGLYAEAVRQSLGADAVVGRYWLVEGTDPDRLPGYEWSPAVRARFMDVLHAIVEGIDDGVFAAVPGDWSTRFLTHENCAHCAFDHVCPVARGEQAEARAGDRALLVRARLQPAEEPA